MRSRTFVPVLVLLALLPLAARDAVAAPILDTGSIVFASTGTQFGRLTRDGVATDWASPPAFPGVIDAPTARHYETFTVNSGAFPYLQVSFDDPAVAFYASAYLGAYTPVNSAPNYGLDVNLLGVPGNSQPFGNPSFFQIVVAPFTDVVVVVNELNPGGGTGLAFGLIVEGFLDTEYNDTLPPAVPEPTSIALVGSGAALLAAFRRKKPSA
jgi:hypothetical protein